jgi:hypothetical protein
MGAMTGAVCTPEGSPVGGWVLRASRAAVAFDAMVERFGQVFRARVVPSGLVELLAPGQPCFLLLTDRSRVVGLWAIGEVVAPPLELTTDRSGLGLAPGRYAEVEMLALAKPLPLDRLVAHKALGQSALAAPLPAPTPTPPSPAAGPGAEVLALAPTEVRALESFDFELVAPNPDQAERLDGLLAAEDAGEDATSGT